MKKIQIKLITILSLFTLAILGCAKESTAKTMKDNMKSDMMKDGMMTKKTLVVYYSLTGTTEKVAEMIKEKLGADILKIEPEKEYDTSSVSKLEALVKKQMANKEKVAIKKINKDISEYDTIIIGTPAWFSEVALPVQTYLSEQNLSDKKVAVFTTYGGTYGNLLTNFEKNVKAKQIKKGIAFSGKQVKEGIDKELNAWIETLK
ncbi:MAG: flavodoxin domain-containing protein [Pseudoleptotrichia goodfellowii]|nr:flavodoxin domain-containing protein [Pseudoleptotrichia goodfellowii]